MLLCLKSKKVSFYTNSNFLIALFFQPEAEFKELEPRLKFKPLVKYYWFHLKLYSMLQDLSGRSIATGFFCGFKTGLKFIKFGHWYPWYFNFGNSLYFIYFNYTGLPTKDDTALQRRPLTLKIRRFQGYTSHGGPESIWIRTGPSPDIGLSDTRY